MANTLQNLIIFITPIIPSHLFSKVNYLFSTQYRTPSNGDYIIVKKKLKMICNTSFYSLKDSLFPLCPCLVEVQPPIMAMLGHAGLSAMKKDISLVCNWKMSQF